MQINKSTPYTALLLLLFGCILCMISLPNHYNFRTFAFDLGMFNHALYDFSHFRHNIFTLDLNRQQSYFADHFAPISILLSPLQFLFGSYTPLLIQCGMIVLGAYYAYAYARLQGLSLLQSRLILIQFFLFWPIIHAVSFDFHTNVLAAMWAIPILYYYEKKQHYKSFIFALLILISKENMGLWLGFFWMGYGLLQKMPPKKFLIRFLIPGIICILYTVITVKYIMPAFNSTDTNYQLSRYTHWGQTPTDIIANFRSNPMLFIELFINLDSSGKTVEFGPKVLVWIMLIFSGGFFAFRRPQYFLMMLPILAQKFLSGNELIQGIGLHYNIEFVPILSFIWINESRNWHNKSRFLLFGILMAASLCAISVGIQKSNPFLYRLMAFYQKDHYSSDFENLPEMKSFLKEIDPTIPLSVSSELAPHLSLRPKIYHFPRIADAQMVVLVTEHSNYYPLYSKEIFLQEIEKIEQMGFVKKKEIPNLVLYVKE